MIRLVEEEGDNESFLYCYYFSGRVSGKLLRLSPYEAQEWPILVESLAFGLYFGMIFYTVQKAEGHFKLQDNKIGITTGLFIVVGLFLFPRLTELIIHGDLPFFK